MLCQLQINDMLIIDQLELDFQPGLNALTGETGAGKSILLDSLGFVLGWRGRAELVRDGADSGEVTAVFHLREDHPARGLLSDAGLSVEDELILRRINTRDGRKQAYINDRRVSAEILRSLSDCLLELHGQQDDKGLLNPKSHRELLDSFAGISLEPLRTAWRELKATEAELAEIEESVAKAKADEEFLRHAVDEFDALAPEPGEEDTLDTERRLMQAGERIRDDVAKAHAALGLDGAERLVGDAARWLGGVADKAEGQLEAALSAIERVLTELGEAEQKIGDFLERLAFDPARLEAAEERLFAIRALARKHGVVPDALPEFGEGLREQLATIDQGASGIEAKRDAVLKAKAKYEAEAKSVSKFRAAAAKQLDQEMAGELAPLKLERAIFETRIEAVEPGPSGADNVTFLVTTNPGTPPGPLNKIASGGELSRFLLALKVCLTKGADGITMIFDEIDRGVGGATADAVGRRLAGLAETSQVLVVTHSPQVAAQAAHHWKVAKEVSKGQTLSQVMPLDASARVEELARMVAGDRITDEARAAAKALLAG